MSDGGPPTLGLVTIGQSPRDDLVPEMRRWLGSVRIVERGALDGVAEDELRTMRPEPDDHALVTRLRDGRSVEVAKRHIQRSVQASIHSLEDNGAAAVVLLCTGEFPAFTHRRPVLMAESLLTYGVRAIAGDASVGVLCPLPEQEDLTREKWRELPGRVTVCCASPYTDAERELRSASERLGSCAPDFIVMDCMGYTQRQRELVVAMTGLPVLLARSIVARLVSEVI